MGQPSDVAMMGGALGNILSWVAGVGGGASLAALIFALIVTRGLLGFAYNVIGAAVSSRISERARNNLHAQYLEVSYDFMRKHEQGQLLELLATESWSVSTAYTSFTRLIINACAISVFVLFLLMLSWRITLAAIIGSMLVSLALRGLSGPMRRLGLEAKQVNQTMAARILTTLQALRTIRAYGQESHHHQSFVDASQEARRTALSLDRLYAVLGPATEIGNLALLCFIIGLPWLMEATFGTTLAAVALLYRLQPHIREFEANLLSLAHLGPSLRAVLTMLDRSDKVYPPTGHRPFQGLGDGIRFEGVSITYRDADHAALDNASFTIPAGRVTALVGPSGAGKTTIVNLLLRMYQPDSGRIRVDGVPLDEITRPEWLGAIAIAGQDIELIEGSIWDNIAMARAGATLEEVSDAGRIAGIEEMVASLPETYNSWIGQQGMNLSGGQRQRIGLARAILRNPSLLILDEAMNALDRSLGEAIRSAISQRLSGRTMLMITHQLETIRAADHVICIRNGRVLEEGSYADLVARPGSALNNMLGRDYRAD
jgi:ABC-type multidrug transport system fused ATPase/permease subunit